MFLFVETSSSSATRTPLRSRDDKKLTSASSDKQKTASSGQDAMMDGKTGTNDDVYEFKSVKVSLGLLGGVTHFLVANWVYGLTFSPQTLT